MSNKNNIDLKRIEHNCRHRLAEYVLTFLDLHFFKSNFDVEYIEKLYHHIYNNNVMFTLYMFNDLKILGVDNDVVLFTSLSKKWLGFNNK